MIRGGTPACPDPFHIFANISTKPTRWGAPSQDSPGHSVVVGWGREAALPQCSPRQRCPSRPPQARVQTKSQSPLPSHERSWDGPPGQSPSPHGSPPVRGTLLAFLKQSGSRRRGLVPSPCHAPRPPVVLLNLGPAGPGAWGPWHDHTPDSLCPPHSDNRDDVAMRLAFIGDEMEVRWMLPHIAELPRMAMYR